MNDLRKAAKDILETLDKPFTASKTIFEAKEALRQALTNEFNPDWNQVEALQESLREHMAEIQRLRQALAEEALQRMTKNAEELELYEQELMASSAEQYQKELAQPEQECTCSAKDMPFGKCCKALPKQQPVKWINFNAATGQESIDDYCDSELASIPLYTAPPSIESAVLAEREACIDWLRNNYQDYKSISDICDAIRARGEK